VTRVIDHESIRSFLLSEVLRFVERARVLRCQTNCPRRSLVETSTIRKMPTCWSPSMTSRSRLSRYCRSWTQGQGAKSRNKGADVFLADPSAVHRPDLQLA